MCCGVRAPGPSSREIAEQSFISETIAANHVQNILVEVGAGNRTRPPSTNTRGLL
jgi:DNA-binding NarL/FixJ family response regulator